MIGRPGREESTVLARSSIQASMAPRGAYGIHILAVSSHFGNRTSHHPPSETGQDLSGQHCLLPRCAATVASSVTVQAYTAQAYTNISGK